MVKHWGAVVAHIAPHEEKGQLVWLGLPGHGSSRLGPI